VGITAVTYHASRLEGSVDWFSICFHNCCAIAMDFDVTHSRSQEYDMEICSDSSYSNIFELNRSRILTYVIVFPVQSCRILWYITYQWISTYISVL
jgi:hypothetical protein